jgi:hypothetical protein
MIVIAPARTTMHQPKSTAARDVNNLITPAPVMAKASAVRM